MTALRQEAIELIQNIPETKIVYIVGILKNLSGLCNEEKVKKQKSRQQSPAYERLLRYKGTMKIDLDYKSELAKARDEKYADFI